MLFTADAWKGIADGTITVTFRRWRRPQAKVGGRYRVGGMLIEVDDVRIVDVGSLGANDAKRAGAASVEALVKRLGEADARDVYRVEFRYVGDDDRIGLRADDQLSPDQMVRLCSRLSRLDGAAPWTQVTLQLIADQPAVVSTQLAELIGTPRPEFKLNVRKLKALGLTESLDVGYRLSPRGAVVLEHLRAPQP